MPLPFKVDLQLVSSHLPMSKMTGMYPEVNSSRIPGRLVLLVDTEAHRSEDPP